MRWGDFTWPELSAIGLVGSRSSPRDDGAEGGARPVVAILPVGAVEAHGPHLPLTTDVIIAEAMADAAVVGLEAAGYAALVLPPVSYAVARFAEGFPGTVSIRPETASALIADIAASLDAQGAAALVVANAHLDPGHIGSIRDGIRDAGEGRSIRVLFPDVTRKPWAGRLTDEFKSGACHAGQYETSIVMAAAESTVREEARRTLDDNPASLSDAIRAGLETFEEAGAPDAYCGYPAKATVEEGRRTIAVLGQIVVDAVEQAMDTSSDTENTRRST